MSHQREINSIREARGQAFRFAKQRAASGESGSILLLVALSLVVLVGMVGLALDVGQLYVAKQQAQTAADAAALAGSVDQYNNSTGTVTSTGQAYGLLNGTGITTSVTAYDCSALPWCTGHLVPRGINTNNVVEAVATTTVNTTFIRILGFSTSTVTAVADAVIAMGPQLVPMVALHPTLPNSLTVAGGTLTICGGPSTALDVDSNSASSINNAGTIDLSHAGPLDSGNCSAGTGAGIDNVGAQNSIGGVVNYGSPPGVYTPSASATQDPLGLVNGPQRRTLSLSPTAAVSDGGAGPLQFAAGSNSYYNCPVACSVYLPGIYPSGIATAQFSVFAPGVYYLDTGGFLVAANTIVRMAVGPADPATGPGMLIYNVGTSLADVLNIQPNSGNIGGNVYQSAVDCPLGGNCLTGSSVTGGYNGVLFYQSRSPAYNMVHNIDSGSGLALSGVLYFTHSRQNDSDYQTLNMTSMTGTCASTGDIIADVINITGCVTVNLSQQLLLFPGIALAH